MIDGFGWFTKADYRRSWLLLDQVQYIFPVKVFSPLSFAVHDRPDFSVVRPEFFDEQLAGATEQDAKSPFLVEVVKRIPREDADYARLVVWCDAEARSGLKLNAPPSTELSVAYLLNKLVRHAQLSGTSPIVGRAYASELISWKVREGTVDLAWNIAAARHRVRIGAFAAGLSLDFVSDGDLEQAEIAKIVSFKERHLRLMERSQRAVLDLASAFESLPESSQFDLELGKLRAAAAQDRQQFEDLGREAWIETGLKLTKRVLAAGTAALGGSLVLLSVPHAIVAAAAAAIGAAAPDVLDAFEKRAKASPPRFAFLMQASKSLRED